MPLPFELTTLPRYSLEIITYLYGCDRFAADDLQIIDALGISERGFGKALRRLVTREYVEMQFDGPYALTDKGVEAAEAIKAQQGEELHQAVGGPQGYDPGLAVSVTVHRRLIAVFPRAYVAGQPGYFFLKVDAPGPRDDLAPGAADLTVRLQNACLIEPAQRDLSVPPDESSPAVRFAVTPPAAGEYRTSIEVFQTTPVDIIKAGLFELTLVAEPDLSGDVVFWRQDFDIALQI